MINSNMNRVGGHPGRKVGDNSLGEKKKKGKRKKRADAWPCCHTGWMDDEQFHAADAINSALMPRLYLGIHRAFGGVVCMYVITCLTWEGMVYIAVRRLNDHRSSLLMRVRAPEQLCVECSADS